MYLDRTFGLRLSLSKITSLFGLSMYLDRTFAQRIVSAKVKSVSEVIECHAVVQSYGGFVASHAVADKTDVYPCGISGAALSDRRYYGSIIRMFEPQYSVPVANDIVTRASIKQLQHVYTVFQKNS